jgi:dihydrofolate synthase/folylpolyglutamate synthase
VGEVLPQTRPVFESIASANSSELIIAPEKRRSIDWIYQHHLLKIEVAHQHSDEVNFYELDLPGYYQTKNIITVLESVRQLQKKGWKISEDAIHKALKQVKPLTGLHGRWERIHSNPTVILDVGHNEDGIKAIVQQLELMDYHQLHIILGMVRDKEIETVLLLLPKLATYYFTRAQIPRALPEEDLKTKAFTAGLNGDAYTDVNTALKAAIAKAHKDDLILVCGSVFVVGEVQL